MWKIIVLCAIVSQAYTAQEVQKATFTNYKVFRIVPITEAHIKILRQFQETPDGFSFWIEPSSANKQVHLMVAPHKLTEFYEIINQVNILYQIHIDNVQKLIDEAASFNRSTTFDFENYHTLDMIYKYLIELAAQYPNNVQVVVGGKTYEGRQIKGVKLSFKANNPGIFIEGGIHAREWISPATVMYILEQLLTSKDDDVRALTESHDWYIFPVFNPDGYVYTHTTNRLWRKTRKPYENCYGTDPNRNWGYKWKTGGSSSDPCSDTYAGTAPFSDIETKSLSEYLKSISDKFYAYISFHSYSQLLMFPYGYTKQHVANYNDLYAIGTKSIKALRKRYNTTYVTGSIAEVKYIASGNTVDYVKGILRKPISYTYELRDKGRHGFLLPPNQIIPTGEETLDSLVALFKEAKTRGYPKNV